MIYALIGPGPWVLFSVGMALAHGRMNRLQRPVGKAVGEPKVSILIPAKDEGERVRVCLDSVLGQDYPNFNVIAVDDRSSDQTGTIMEEYAAKSQGKVRAIHVPQGGLPAGWLGKCQALWTAAQRAEGEWILFVDSDVKLQPDAL